MTEKELELLIQKYLEGKATSQEISYLEKLEKDAEHKILKEVFLNDSDEAETKESIFNNIEKNIDVKQALSWWKYASIAAIFIGIFTSGYFLYENLVYQNKLTIPSDAITLELEDGSIEILNETRAKALMRNDGKVIGQQINQLITYEKTKSEDKLAFNTLSVPYGKRFELMLSDGTHIELNAGSSIKYPVKFIKGQPRKVFLSGEAFFDVTKDTLHPFTVNAGALDVRVLGTRFNVSSYAEDEHADVVLVEGSVGMQKNGEVFNEKKSTILLPGYKGSFLKSDGEIHMEPVVTNVYTAWMNGELVFRNMTFQNILKKMERHFNVTIINENYNLGKEIFNASYGDISLEEVFEQLKLTHEISYEINGDTVIIN